MKRRAPGQPAQPGQFITVGPAGLGFPLVSRVPRGRAAGSVVDEAEVALPPHVATGFLPPHLGERFVLRHGCSPWRISPLALVERYATSPGRIELLERLFRMRRDARALGVTAGFSWIGGSFVDARGEPNDLDVVTFYVPSGALDGEEGKRTVRANPDIFKPTKAKETYGCDAYFLALRGNRKSYRMVSLWYALFSHDRETLVWKGFVEIGLSDRDDTAAIELLRTRTAEPGASV
jgi:hypothetical protein